MAAPDARQQGELLMPFDRRRAAIAGWSLAALLTWPVALPARAYSSPAPRPEPTANAAVNAELNDVAVFSAQDAWTVGDQGLVSTGEVHALAEHWAGQQWQVAATPSPGIAASLGGVSAVAPADVWPSATRPTPTTA
jgi:hypothetical protein